MNSRYVKEQILKDLEQKMVFLAGPRQCGKTTLAKTLVKNSRGYMNWDEDAGRESILSKTFSKAEFWIFDEIHKFKRWRNYLKGIFDQHGKAQKILVTGSARLDLYRRGGDSLQGRYHFLRMHPLSFNEIKGRTQEDLETLFELGPFPEPFFSSSKKTADRWSLSYRTRLIFDEIPPLETVKDINLLDVLARTLPERVGSPLSINNLRENLDLSFRAVSNWLVIFEKLYLIYRLRPFGSPLIKSVKKETKHYHFDWNLVDDEGARFENFIGNHLLKWVHFETDSSGRDLDLKFVRNEAGKEVDFVVTEKLKPILFVECKWSDTQINPFLIHLKKKFPKSRAIQVLMNAKKEFIGEEGIEVISAKNFLKELV